MACQYLLDREFVLGLVVLAEGLFGMEHIFNARDVSLERGIKFIIHFCEPRTLVSAADATVRAM